MSVEGARKGGGGVKFISVGANERCRWKELGRGGGG